MSHKIFQIDTTIQPHSDSFSSKAARYFVEKLQARFRDSDLIYRDLYQKPVPFITDEWAQAAVTPQAMRSDAQKQMMKSIDMSPLVEADIYVFALAGYMYDAPASFKSWLEHIWQFDITISPDWKPLLKDKKMVVISAWAGDYNSVTPEIGYEFVIKQSFAKIGVTDIKFFNIFNTDDITANIDDVERDLEKYANEIN